MAVEAQEILSCLKAAFPSAVIDLKDLVGDQDHYEVKIFCDSFVGKPRVIQHQMVYQALGERMKSKLHALSIKTSPKEQS